ncbi:MAG: hypothetical protein KGL39_53665 [Patescibacteria group bacterium]|nr:hypothetical protein [Patescibacteria group bacterium]
MATNTDMPAIVADADVSPRHNHRHTKPNLLPTAEELRVPPSDDHAGLAEGHAMTEPRVLITAIKCQKCGLDYETGWVDGEIHLFPAIVSVRYARNLARTPHSYRLNRPETPYCGGSVLIATEPVPTSHISGGAEWMNTLRFGDLDGEEPADKPVLASPEPCPDCGQLAMIGAPGVCPCKQEASDGEA